MKSKIEIGIIGLGRFGTLTATILSNFFEVKIHHYRYKKENEQIVKKIGASLVSLEEVTSCDYLILAVPISKTKELIQKIAPLLKSETIIIDTCSVKELPCRWLKKYLPVENPILGTHPMFGPVTTNFNLDQKHFELSDKQIVLCPIRISSKKLNIIKDFLNKLKLEVTVTTPKEHDRQNAKTLSLVHFLGRSLTKAGIREQKIFTPGYSDLLKILPHTNNDDWQLFYDMNNFNLYSEKIRNNFLKACNLIELKILKAGAENDFDFNRKKINLIDQKIFGLLEDRMVCAENIGKIKKEKGLKIVDSEREQIIIKRRITETKLKKRFVENFYQLLFKESYKKQQ